jgi:single-strand DNA-binding protein
MSKLNNSATLIGHIGQEPDVRHTQSGTTVASFSLATNNKYKNESGEWIETTEWHRVVCFGKLAEIVQDIAEKGQKVAVRGRITYNEWETKEGVKRKDMQIKCEDFQILSSKSERTRSAPEPKPTRSEANGHLPPDLIAETKDDDLPF